MEGSIFRLYSLLSNADDEMCSVNITCWSVKAPVDHLYDLAELWWKRLQDFTQNKPMITTADLKNTKTKEANNNEKKFSDKSGFRKMTHPISKTLTKE